MSRKTEIQWCDSTVNPVMGCDGCELWRAGFRACYAGNLHLRYGGQKGYAQRFDVPELFPGRMAEAAKWNDLRGTVRPDKPWLDGLPRHIFISDMGDALSRVATFEWLYDEIVCAARYGKGVRHRWLWLTKRPSRMREFYEHLRSNHCFWPSNLWAMTSVTGRKTERRATELMQVGDAETVRGISFEPLLDEPDWEACLGGGGASGGKRTLDWAIFGGLSGHEKRPTDVAWMRRGIEACRERGIAVFVKQLGACPVRQGDGESLVQVSIEGIRGTHGGNWDEWPEDLADLKVREMPEVRA